MNEKSNLRRKNNIEVFKDFLLTLLIFWYLYSDNGKEFDNRLINKAFKIAWY